MKKHISWQMQLGSLLLLVSAFLYGLHYFIFRDAYNIFFYLISNIAFLPVEVLLVTLILHRLLNYREKQARLEKMNMVIGAFYSECGQQLIVVFSAADPKQDDLGKELRITSAWTEQTFTAVTASLKPYPYQIDVKNVDLEGLKSYLLQKREFLLRLLENPNLLEHESFTELLLALFHLTEELGFRKDLKLLPTKDAEHIANDIKRVYALLVRQWLEYMEHLLINYPYLFSLAMRTNPFDKHASIEII